MEKKKKKILDILEDAKRELSNYNILDIYEKLYEDKDFLLFNSYITLKAFLEKKNIYISTNSKESAIELTLPIIYPIASLLLKYNSELYHPNFEDIAENYIFMNNRKCYKYVDKDGIPSLKYKIKDGYGYKHFMNREDILKSYFIIDKKYYTEKRSCAHLDQYKDRFSMIVGKNIIPPSFYPHKMIVVCQKNDFYKHLRIHSMSYFFPIKYITQNNEISDVNLPIDSLIIIASNYELSRFYIREYCNSYGIDYFLMIGDNKINKYKSQIKNDCANGLFSNFCLIGNQEISTDNTLILWNWTKREEQNLSGKYGIQFDYNSIDECQEFNEIVQKYYSIIHDIIDEYSTSEFVKDAREGLLNIIYDKLNTIENFDIEVGNIIKTKITNSLLSNNYEEEDIQENVNKLISILKEIYLFKINCSNIIDKIFNINKEKEPIVVHKNNFNLWENKLKSIEEDTTLLCTFREFKSRIMGNNNTNSYIFTYIPNYKQLNWLYNIVLEREITLQFLLYSPEIKIMKTRLKKMLKYSNYGYKDNSLFLDADFCLVEKESTDDLISRFEDGFVDNNDSIDIKSEGYYVYNPFELVVLDYNGNPKIVTSPYKILKKDESSIELVSAEDLKENDIILLYENKSRESLYEILSSESEKIAQVNYYSSLWKNKLRQYIEYNNTVYILNKEKTYNQNKLNKLAKDIGINPEYILNNWINEQSKTRFPQKSKLDMILTFFMDNNILNLEETEGILSARNFFTGIMISLGQNLSAELQSIKLGVEENLEEFIIKEVIKNEKEYPILSRFDADSISSIIKHNYIEYQFIQIKEGSNLDDE